MEQQLEAGFPDGSTTCALLKSLLEGDADFTTECIKLDVLQWVTGRRVVPALGLAATPSGMIKLKWDEKEHVEEAKMWPRARTCFHTVLLPNYSDPRILKEKLLIAIAVGDRAGGFTEL